ncbi:MAG: PAS domain S-box protein, partial [Anaerolineales bacterium]|nr:PAS domain S-box protein [Anaerolineales bacterium]
GTIGMALSSFRGDGRIFFFALIILTAVFFDLRYSVTATIFTFLTLVVIGWLQVSGVLFVPAGRQTNATDAGAWITGGIVLLVLSGAVFISVTYLLRALNNSLNESRESLEREQRLGRILRMVSDINQLIVRETDPQKILVDACQLLVSGRGYAFTWVGLLEEDGITLKLAASAGKTIDPDLFIVHLDQAESIHSCAAIAIRSRKYFRVMPSSGDDPCQVCPHRIECPLRTAIALPLLRADDAFGVLVVDHTLPSDGFDDEEIKLLQELANDLAFALEKLKTDRRLQAHIRRETLINEITRAALETPDLETMMQSLVERLSELIGAYACCIVLLDENGEKFIPAAASGYLREEFFSITLEPEEIEMAFALLKTGQPLIVNNTRNDPRVSSRVAALFAIESLLGLPLNADGKKLGAIFLVFNETHYFTDDEISFVEQATGHAALALAKAILYKETRTKASELGSLYAAAQDMASSIMDPPALLEKLARHMTEALNATSGNIMAMDLAAETMQVVGEYWSEDALPLEKRSDLGRVYSSNDYSTIMRAMISSQVCSIHADSENITEAEREQFKGYGVQSMMFVPIMAQGQLFGNIEIWESRRKRDFTLAEINLAQAMAGHAASIIQNADLVNALRISEARYRTLIEQASDGIFIANAQRQYVEVNSAGCQMLGYTREEILNLTMDDLVTPEDMAATPFRMKDLLAGQKVITERFLRRKDGFLLPVEISAKILPNGNLQGIVRDITERKLAEKALAEREAYFRALIENSAEGVAILDVNGKISYMAPSEERLTGYTVQEVMGGSIFRGVHPDDMNKLLFAFQQGIQIPGAIIQEEYRHQRKNGEWRNYEVTGHNLLHDPKVAGVVINYRDITERKLTEDALMASERKFRALAENIPSVVYLCKNDSRYTMIYLNDAIEELSGHSKNEFLAEGLSFYDLYHPDDLTLIPSVSDNDITTINKDPFHITYRIRHKSGEWRWVDEWGVGVLDDDGNVQYLEGVMIDVTERKRVEEDLVRRAHELEALAAASAALRTAQSVIEMVPVLAKQALRAVRGDYSSIFLLDPESGDYISHGWFSSRGETKNRLKDESVLRHRPGEGITGHVALTGEIYVTEDMQKDPVISILDGEKKRMQRLHGGISLPLRAQENIIGVMHIWTVEPHIFSETEIRILIAFAETAGNAIHRAMLFEQTLQHANELALAYDNTLAGWARALELRDEITEGHTRRVTELTLQLARALNISENELVQIRRGALLHDIGKMGIPDSILHKPGPFTMQERAIMQRHAQYAYDMISAIPFLQSALDIPFCHHEHWDGNGYPRKLMGEEIPLAARIFSVVDVWDALTSDRPYRMAWSKEKTREYIIERAGKQFDPHIVEVFFSLEIE